MSSNCTLCAIKVFNATGHGFVSGAIAGIDHVVAKCGASSLCVANLSLESKYSKIFDASVAAAVTAGVVVVVAAGNGKVDACLDTSPASTVSAITVGSTTINDAKSSFSNWGSCVDVYAPGSGITSAWNSSPTATRMISGTSMATPRKFLL